jgi:hypothetical protein
VASCDDEVTISVVNLACSLSWMVVNQARATAAAMDWRANS